MPTERLARIRQLFYPETEIPVVSQRAPFVENQRWSDADVTYALVHVVGSDNGRAPWFGGAETPAQREQRLAEVEAREAAALDWIDRSFDAAERSHARGVVIGMQADTFVTSTAFDSINARLEQRARRFKRPVLLLQGDTHVYKTDRPFAGAPNLVHVVVEGETASEWLRLTVDPRTRDVFSWKRMPLAPQLTVASYNIHHGAGPDDRLDLERVAAEIKRTGAAVVGLQEVDRFWSERSAFVDQAQWLADRLGMQVVYGANLDLDPPAVDRPRRQYGTAILSSHPIVYSRNTPLPRPQNGEQRGLLEAAIDVDGTRVRVANTHLQHNSAVERRAQTERIAELLAPVSTPVILVGDLNAPPGAAELAPLAPRFADAWTRGGTGDGFSYPASAPNARIDYVLTTQDVDVRSARTPASPASDHLPVIADLELPRARAPEPEAFDLQAHRGGLGLATESTLAAFANALELGVSTLELDIQITEDGGGRHPRPPGRRQQVPRHGPGLRRRPRVPVRRQVRQGPDARAGPTLDCGSQHAARVPRPAARRPGARMPLLSDVFALVEVATAHAGQAQHRDQGRGRRAAGDRAARAVRPGRRRRDPRGRACSTSVTIQSFDWGALMRMREVEPRLPLVALTNGDFLQVGKPGASPWLGGIDIDDFGGDFVAAAAPSAPTPSRPSRQPAGRHRREPGYRAYTRRTWSTTPTPGPQGDPLDRRRPATMAALMDLGVDGIITDYPDRLRTIMAARGLQLPKPERTHRSCLAS